MTMPTLEIEKTLRLQNARLAALHEVTMGLTSTLALSEVLQRVVEMAQALSDSAHAHIFLYDDKDDELNLVASQWSSQQREVTLQPRREGITYQVARNGQSEFIVDTTDHPAYELIPSKMRPGALACLPLKNAGRVLGTLNLGYWEPYPFDDDTRLFLELMARQAALAIDTARMHADEIKRAQLERELQMAREFQASLIPTEMPYVESWDIAAMWQPAHTVSGDFYDFIEIEAGPLQGLVIADISDKGMPAALFTALARSTIRASITTACCLADWMTHANRVLSADTVSGMFVTMCFAQISPAHGEMIYVNAGHNPPLLFHHADHSLTALKRTGIALGADEFSSFEQHSVTLEYGDFVFFYTDGMLEAANINGEEFGLEGLKRIVLDNQSKSASEIVSALRDTLNTFIGVAPQFDDMTTVVLKRKATG